MNQAKAYLARATLLAMVAGTAAVVWTGAARAQDEDDVRPVDYVRVCDAYGSGYFYIPGTETCLRIGGYVRYNFRQSENTNSVGTGTLRYGLGNDERYAGSFGKRIDSHGFGVGGYLRGDYGDLSIGKFPVVGAYFGYDGTWGEDSYSSSAMVGYNNITVAALTFAHPDPMYGNGIFSGFMGDGLESSGGLDRDEHRVNLGLKIGVYDSGRLNRLLNNGTAPSTVEDGHGISRVIGRIGLFYEGQSLDAYGVSDFTRNGMVFPGFYQNFQLETRDNTFGLQLGTKVDFDPCFDDRLRTSLSTDLYLGYHSGKGHFYQETGVGGGNTVIQMQDYSDSGLSVGAGISATATYSFDRDTHLSAQLKWNIKSDVTSYYQRPSPNGGNSGFSSDSEQSWTGSIRFARSF